MSKATQKLSEKIIFKNQSWPIDTTGESCLFNDQLYLKTCIPDKKELFRFSMWRSKKEMIAINYLLSNNCNSIFAGVRFSKDKFTFPMARAWFITFL